MDKLLFMKKHLEKYTEAGFTLQIFGWLARLFALVAIVYGLYIFVDNWIGVRGGTELIIATIICQLLWILIIILVFHIWWMKGSQILMFKNRDYVMVPVATRYLKAIGESLAVINIFLSTGYMLTSWLTNRLTYGDPDFFCMLFSFSTKSAFLHGLLLFVNGVVGGLLLCGFFYLISEILIMWLEVARNTRK